jgi:hypothetical protein
MRELLVVSVAVALVVAGCGGNEAPTAEPAAAKTTAAPEATATTSTTTTAAAAVASSATVDFVAAANKICNGMQRDAEGLESNVAAPSDEQLATLVDSWRSGVKRLDALEPQRERKRQFLRMLAHYRNMLRALELMLEAKDETVLAAVAGVAVEGQRGSRAARKAGVRACAFFPEITQPAPDPQDLYEATRDLIPAKARILRDAELDCVALDMCVVDYELDTSVDARIRAARALLRAHHWQNVRSGRTPTGGWWLMANRNDYAATLEFVGETVPEHCGGRVTYGCSDSVSVRRVEVPDVLTGG